MASQEYLSAPWMPLRKLADCAPVFWSEALHAWVVTRHEDVKAAYADRRPSTARMELYLRNLPGDAAERYATLIKYHNLGIAFMDAPSHMRVRTLMMKAFGRRQIDDAKPMIIAIIDDVLDQMEQAREFDFVSLVSAQLPTRVIQAILGVPRSLTKEFFGLASAIITAMGSVGPSAGQMAAADDAVVRLNEIFVGLIEQRRRAPSADLLSALVEARDAGDRLSEDALLAACTSIVEAGAETTAHMLAICFKIVAEQSDLRDLVRLGPDSALPVVDELLRHPGLVMGMTRIVREDFEWHGTRLRAGEIVFMMNVATNHDPAVFADPDTIDPQRDVRNSLSFGPGLHHCIGHYLARTELAEFLHRAFAQFDVLLLDDDTEYIQSYVFRGLKSLSVKIARRTNSVAGCGS